jgi:hypothetical protein
MFELTTQLRQIKAIKTKFSEILMFRFGIPPRVTNLSN